jgi:hypothetical protein
MLQLGNIKNNTIFFFNFKYENFICHLLVYNTFVQYTLHDFWYEVQKKSKKYATENALPC